MKDLFFKYYEIDRDKWIEISNQNIEKFKNLFWKLPTTSKSYNIEEIVDLCKDEELFEIQKTLINKIATLRISYIFLSYYYELGIPDENWYISPGKDGSSVEYFTNFKEDHFYIHYFFSLWCEIFYIKFFSIIDSIFEFLNYYFCFNFEPEKERHFFNKKVIRELKKKEQDLYSFLSKIKEFPEYKDAEKFRNEIIHRTSLYEIKDTIIKNETSIIWGIGKYTTSKKLKENIDKVLGLLSTVIEKLKEKGLIR